MRNNSMKCIRDTLKGDKYKMQDKQLVFDDLIFEDCDKNKIEEWYNTVCQNRQMSICKGSLREKSIYDICNKLKDENY